MDTHCTPSHYAVPAPSDADLDALLAAASTFAPHRRALFDLLVQMGTTLRELAGVFDLPHLLAVPGADA